MFLATEGMYAEVLRPPGLLEEIQHDHRIVITGPTTITAILTSLRMGFPDAGDRKAGQRGLAGSGRRKDGVWQVRRRPRQGEEAVEYRIQIHRRDRHAYPGYGAETEFSGASPGKRLGAGSGPGGPGALPECLANRRGSVRRRRKLRIIATPSKRSGAAGSEYFKFGRVGGTRWRSGKVGSWRHWNHVLW